MAKIIGNTTATPNPRPDWAQTDASKADYIKNKPNITNGEGEYSLKQRTANDTEPIVFKLANPASPSNGAEFTREATGANSVLFGDWNRNEAPYSIVGGDGNVYDAAKSGRGMVLGRYNHVQGDDGLTVGSQNYVGANRSIVAGNLNKLNAGSWGGAIVSGSENEIGTDSPNSFISGLGNQISANAANAFIGGGRNNIADAKDQAVFGYFAAANPEAVLKVGNGQEPTADNGWKTTRQNALEVLKNGTVRAANYTSLEVDGVPGAEVTGIQSVAFGGRRFDYDGDEEDVTSEITANQSFSSGCGNKIINNSHWSATIGKDNIIGQYLDDDGNLQDADLTYCVTAVGNANKIANRHKQSGAKYFSGMAVGISNELYGTKSFIQGSGNKIGSELSFVSGYMNESNGPRSTIFGGNNNIKLVYTPKNLYNMILGSGNTIEQTISKKFVRNNVLLGTGLKLTDKENQTILGKYNEENSDLIFSIGNGTSDTDRKNVFEVHADGRASVQSAPVEANDVVRQVELDTKYDKTGGLITGDVSIQGNLTVSGETTTLDTVTLQVQDNVIVANADGAELVENAGFAMKTSATAAYGIMYDPAGDGVKIGLGAFNDEGKFIYAENEAQFLATRADSINDGSLPVWNDTTKSFEDSNVNVSDLQNTVKTLQEQVAALQEALAAITAATADDIKTIFNEEA